MPTALLNAHAEQLPRLSAEESLLAAERHGVGAGTLQRSARRRIAGEWQRLARQDRVVLRPKTSAEHDAYMAMNGIAVKRVAVKRDG